MHTDTPINILWFKRDLRLEDNDSLSKAFQSSNPLLLIYFYEPSIWEDLHYDIRHKQFIQETLFELKLRFDNIDCKLFCLEEEVLPFFQRLFEQFKVEAVYSTQETGLDITYKRDIAFAKACKIHNIPWYQAQNNGILRAMHNRKTWRNAWYSYMQSEIAEIPKRNFPSISKELRDFVLNNYTKFSLEVAQHNFQKGGRKEYQIWKESFFNKRLEFYSEYISKPEKSRYGCSRLSPYISWGVCSIRELYQEAQTLKKDSTFKRQINAFNSRLRWQSHFIQKFESEPRMEFEAINKGFLDLPQPINKEYIQAWKEGKTGYPLVDASLRCVVQTGYINFRMRSMIVSFLTHHLFQHFTTGSAWLARQFLDFEPGIHYGQFQMQSGLTGINTVRVYNPSKNAKDHDSDAIFIKKWVPELKNLPTALAIEPWNATDMESQLYNFKLGADYPFPIVDIKETRKVAVTKLYGQRKNEIARSERLRILERHTIRRASDKDDGVQI